MQKRISTVLQAILFLVWVAVAFLAGRIIGGWLS